MLAYMYASDFVVLEVIKDNDGKRMTHQQIVDRAGGIVSYATVIRAINRLESDDKIKVKRHKGSPQGNEYHVR